MLTIYQIKLLDMSVNAIIIHTSTNKFYVNNNATVRLLSMSMTNITKPAIKYFVMTI